MPLQSERNPLLSKHDYASVSNPYNLMKSIVDPSPANDYSCKSQISCLSHPSPQRLPLEILEDIVASIGVDLIVSIRLDRSFDTESRSKGWSISDRTRTLLSCALVCRDLVPRSRICLYQDVRLDNKRKASSFMMTVATSPRLGPYVKSLEINPRHEHHDWIYKIHQVLPRRLPNLVCLTYRDFPIVHPLFFVLSSQFNSVTHLEVADMKSWTFREIVRLLDRFTQLKTLQVGECLRESPSYFYCRQREKKPPIVTSFKLSSQSYTSSRLVPSSSSDNVYNIVNWLTKTFPSHSLTRLSFAPPYLPAQSLDFRDLLYQCFGTLKELQLVIHHSFYTLPRPDDHNIETTWLPAITSCQKLRKITIVAEFPQYLGHLEPLFLRYLPRSLCVISFQFSEITMVTDFSSSNPKWINAFWEEFDNAMTNMSRFPTLASVVLKWAIMFGPKTTPDEAIVEHLEELREWCIFDKFLPKLYDSGILFCGHYRSDAVFRASQSASGTVTREGCNTKRGDTRVD